MTVSVVARGVGAAVAGLTGVTAFRYRSVVQREASWPSNTLHVFSNDTKQRQTSNVEPQRVIVLGAGVVGICTAYKLAHRGHQVVVLEPAQDAGTECSACAAGGMSRQNVTVDRNTWMAVLKCLIGWHDGFEFFRIDWLASLSDPHFLKWATTFTWTSFFPTSNYADKQSHMLKFTDFAVHDMVNMFQKDRKLARQAGYNPNGSLAVSYASETDGNRPPDKTSAHAKAGNTLEPHRMIQSTKEILQTEPSLAFQQRPPTSAKFEYEAKAASSGRFTQALAQQCLNDPKLNVQILYDTKVHGISTTSTKTNASRKTRITELQTNRGRIPVPSDAHVVVATGAWTPHVLALMGLYAPVYPLKGYALSVSAKEALQSNPRLRPCDLPSRILCDPFMYTTRLGEDEIRITSLGEFSKWNTEPTPSVDANFRAEAKRQFPQLSSLIDAAKTYCGHRPYVADGLVLLGAVDSVERLYVRCGPGSNGWKLALGSGELVARQVSGETAEDIQMALGFDPSAFDPSGRVTPAPFFAKLCRARWNV